MLCGSERKRENGRDRSTKVYKKKDSFTDRKVMHKR